ncbi:hypothetical protein AAC387_Pa02g1696 [Persea americana]
MMMIQPKNLTRNDDDTTKDPYQAELYKRQQNVIMENGILKLTMSQPDGALTGIQYGGMKNLLDTKLTQSQRGYWDINWNLPGGGDRYLLLKGTEFNIISSNNDRIEVSFGSICDPSERGTTLPLSVDKRFHYMAITDEKQRIMPMPEDLSPRRCKVLALPESVLLTNPINPTLKGEVDDKYQYSMDNKDGGVHGWISSDPIVGFWIIFPTNEFRNGGPTKQNLTVHTGPAALARLVEETTWPYNFVSSPYFLTTKERGSASGRLFVQDRYVSGALIPAKSAYVGLATARTEGSWQTESKGYQFWVSTDSNGTFTINNVVPGVYAVHGWVPGFIGDYLSNVLVTIFPGSEIQLGNITFSPPRDGPTLWEIGFPDRTAMGFFVPNPNPSYINKLYINSPEKFRQYGLWDRYTDTHPESDQVFVIGVNDSKKDWFFAHVTRSESMIRMVIMENGILKLTMSQPDGALTGIQYGGMKNLLDTKLTQFQRGYWDINWNLPGGGDRYLLFILRSGISGFYCYAIYERLAGWPAFDLVQIRLVFKLRRELFHYMAITDEKQRIMPMPEDLSPRRCKVLALPESVLLTNPINPALKGEVDDKYQYSMDNKDGGVHGWISSDPIVGFWIIFPTNEFRNGGPTKQNLTVHTGPAALAMFHGTHYIGDDIVANFREGEAWRKDFNVFTEYERYVSGALIPAKSAYVGLATARTEGSWQTESKGYQFWVSTDSNGTFTINNVVPGVYAVHGWVPGFIGDYLSNVLVTISPGT